MKAITHALIAFCITTAPVMAAATANTATVAPPSALPMLDWPASTGTLHTATPTLEGLVPATDTPPSTGRSPTSSEPATPRRLMTFAEFTTTTFEYNALLSSYLPELRRTDRRITPSDGSLQRQICRDVATKLPRIFITNAAVFNVDSAFVRFLKEHNAKDLNSQTKPAIRKRQAYLVARFEREVGKIPH